MSYGTHAEGGNEMGTEIQTCIPIAMANLLFKIQKNIGSHCSSLRFCPVTHTILEALEGTRVHLGDAGLADTHE